MTTTTTDPISDMLTRIRNAIAVNKSQVDLPHSNIKQAVAEILKKNNYITDVRSATDGPFKILELTLNEDGQNSPITSMSRLSRPGRRQYVGSDAIPVVKRGRGIVIISTSKGLMTGDDAKKAGIGGELICEVY